jgi:lipopolysaccharide biosynthesis regulator YciM
MSWKYGDLRILKRLVDKELESCSDRKRRIELEDIREHLQEDIRVLDKYIDRFR